MLSEIPYKANGKEEGEPCAFIKVARSILEEEEEEKKKAEGNSQSL